MGESLFEFFFLNKDKLYSYLENSVLLHNTSKGFFSFFRLQTKPLYKGGIIRRNRISLNIVETI